MQMESTFDFKIVDNDYIYRIGSDTVLIIKRLSNSVATLSFIDEFGNCKNIPDGIRVYTHYYHFESTSRKFEVKPSKQGYALCWTDDYAVELNGKEIINIKSQRGWNIKS